MVPNFERYELVTGAGTYDLVVPKKDGGLVRHVFGGGSGLQRAAGEARTVRVLGSERHPGLRPTEGVRGDQAS